MVFQVLGCVVAQFTNIVAYRFQYVRVSYRQLHLVFWAIGRCSLRNGTGDLYEEQSAVRDLHNRGHLSYAALLNNVVMGELPTLSGEWTRDLPECIGAKLHGGLRQRVYQFVPILPVIAT